MTSFTLARARYSKSESVARTPPLLDLMMPAMNGWDFIERYTDQIEGELIPIVVVSAAGAIPRSMYALGVRQFIAKPFDVQNVIDALERI